jgi:hypothetical protein
LAGTNQGLKMTTLKLIIPGAKGDDQQNCGLHDINHQ